MRAKMVYIIAVLVTVMLGISTRTFGERLPSFISSHMGDVLWACMIYCAFRVLLARHQLWLSLVMSLSFCFAIEFSQLYQADWINGIRATLPGGLILGKGFLWIDLILYIAGILLSFALDCSFSNRYQRIEK